jgi:DNA-binding NarL/FixJ family response regulator
MSVARRQTQPGAQAPGDCSVLLVEDDPYARDLVSLMLTRDWRVNVVGEVGRARDAAAWLSDPGLPPVDVVLVDGEHPSDSNWVLRLAPAIKAHPRIAFVCTLTQLNEHRLHRLTAAGFHGCILKREIGYCLADAAALASRGYWVMTPGVRDLIGRLPARRVVLRSNARVAQLSDRELRVARLAILFEQSREDVAHELGLSCDSVRRTVSDVYTRIGLHDLLSGDQPPDHFFADRLLADRIAAHLKAALATGSRLPVQKSTLAFHLLTAAEAECHPA